MGDGLRDRVLALLSEPGVEVRDLPALLAARDEASVHELAAVVAALKREGLVDDQLDPTVRGRAR